jgi:hypothetical protein
MNAVWFLAIVLVSISAWVSVFWVVPWCRRSVVRYQLWQLRDGLFDAIRGQHFENSEQPRRLLRDIEMSIQSADRITPLNFWLAQRFVKHLDIKLDEPFELRATSIFDQKKLAPWYDGYKAAMARLLMTGSPSGWLLLLFFFPKAIVLTTRVMRDKRSGSVADAVKEQVQSDDREAALLVVGGSRAEKALSACV